MIKQEWLKVLCEIQQMCTKFAKKQSDGCPFADEVFKCTGCKVVAILKFLELLEVENER